MSVTSNLMPKISKLFCSPSQVIFTVRNRPHVVSGGGFVVTNTNQTVVFKVDGCGTLGIKGQLILRDGDGESLLYIRRKGGIVQALSVNKQWKGFLIDYEGAEKLVFTLREPTSWALKSSKIRVSVESKTHNNDWDFEIKGSFVDRACCINDRKGNIVAQVRKLDEVEELMSRKDVYHLLVNQALTKPLFLRLLQL
ncbi:protein LURP-one-related 6-like [Tasmannia lanceolata]|uniref:protein LURP-one-related 6-like n=1 Tax=Tasmannia lanceolata TaxID=3420 RepID=UPI0040639A02